MGAGLYVLQRASVAVAQMRPVSALAVSINCNRFPTAIFGHSPGKSFFKAGLARL